METTRKVTLVTAVGIARILMRSMMQRLVLFCSLVLFHFHQVDANEENEIDLRSSGIYGRACFSSRGYSGSCRSQKYCRGSSYSYSR